VGTTRSRPIASSPTWLPKHERREQLVDLAAEMVREEGVANLTMEKLAERAKINKAIVYRSFPNSGSVLGALFDRETAALRAANRKLVVDGSSVRGSMPAVLELYFDSVGRTGDLLTTLLSGPAVDPILLERRRAWREDAIANWGRIFRDATGAPLADAEDAVAIAMGAIDGAVARWRVDGVPRARVEKRAVQVVNQVLDQLAAPFLWKKRT
jgi:AcrR family transcriptional regulator